MSSPRRGFGRVERRALLVEAGEQELLEHNYVDLEQHCLRGRAPGLDVALVDDHAQQARGCGPLGLSLTLPVRCC